MCSSCEKLLLDYNYSPEATKMLDNQESQFKSGNISLQNIYEVMLWKLDRFPTYKNKIIDNEIINIIKNLSKIKSVYDEKMFCIDSINGLLNVKGFRLPMISTILSFVNPDVFQIIDKRTNRMVLGGTSEYLKDYGKDPADYYLKYLDKLTMYGKVNFKIAGRIFYQLDKNIGCKVNTQVSDIDNLPYNISKEYINKVMREFKKQ